MDSANLLQICCTGPLQWIIKEKYFPDGQTSLLLLVQKLAISGAKVFWNIMKDHFFYYGNRCVQVAQQFLEYLQFYAEEIYHGSVANKDHESVWHELSFCSCRSLAITERQNTTSIL